MNSPSRDPGDLIPLTPLVFHVLLSLVAQQSHGYAIIQDVRERSGSTVRIGSGRLYAAIRRLLQSGLVTEVDERPAPEADDERRRYYAMTRLGRRVVRAETQRMAEAVRMAEGLLLARPPAGETSGE